MKDYWNSISTGKKIRLIFILFLVLLGLIFAIRNWQSTEVILVFYKVELPLTLIITISGIIGYAISALFEFRKFMKKDKEIADLKEKIKNLMKDKGDRL